jgi:hypothetical protein
MPLLRETDLERSRTQPIHRQRLAACLGVFWKFAADAGVDTTAMDTVPGYAASAAAGFVQYCFDTQVPFWRAKYGLLAIQTHWRHLRGRLGRGWDALRSWGLQRPQRSRLPLPWEVLKAMVGLAFCLGLEGGRKATAFFSMSVLLRVGFYGLLRPAEICSLRCRDICSPRPRDPEGVLVLGLREPKNRSTLGRNQFALIKNAECIEWVRWLCHGLPEECNLWPGSQARFGHMFRQLLGLLELSHHNFTPGSLRPGGTTREFMRGTPVSELKFMGRWATESSLAIYVQESMAHKVWNSLSAADAQLLEAWEDASKHIWEAPPHSPWTALFGRQRQAATMKRPIRSRLRS